MRWMTWRVIFACVPTRGLVVAASERRGVRRRQRPRRITRRRPPTALHVRPPGEAMQVDPIKPMLKPPRTKQYKLKCDELVSTSAFKFNLRRCTPPYPPHLPHPAHPVHHGQPIAPRANYPVPTPQSLEPPQWRQQQQQQHLQHHEEEWRQQMMWSGPADVARHVHFIRHIFIFSSRDKSHHMTWRAFSGPATTLLCGSNNSSISRISSTGCR